MADTSKIVEMGWKDIHGCEGYDPEQGKLTLRGIEIIPDDVFHFALQNRVNILDASDNPDLKTLPDHLKLLSNLERIFLSNCGFDAVPPQLQSCTKLKMLAMKFCGISEFADDVLPPSMEWLILTGNDIKQLPKSIGDLVNLRKVALAGNPIERLPNEMQQCVNIELLRVSAANLEEPTPAWVFHLPKLAWFSDAGNPASRAYPETLLSGFNDIVWQDLELSDVVAQSPSSTVSKATLKEYEGAVAAKIFKDGLASDGYARDDFMCSAVAGAHPNLRNIVGLAAGHPQGRDVIVTDLVPQDEYSDLGNPPNFETCTRDTFSKGTTFEPWFVKSVLLNVALAMVHLHERNLAHGDLYAHNIQVNKAGHAIVGDFGAATYYDVSERYMRESLDVLAFGYLADDLIQRMQGDRDVQRLYAVRERCLDQGPETRPGFRELAVILNGADI